MFFQKCTYLLFDGTSKKCCLIIFLIIFTIIKNLDFHTIIKHFYFCKIIVIFFLNSFFRLKINRKTGKYHLLITYTSYAFVNFVHLKLQFRHIRLGAYINLVGNWNKSTAKWIKDLLQTFVISKPNKIFCRFVICIKSTK